MMGRLGGGLRKAWLAVGLGAAALGLAGCAGGPEPTIFDLAAATPPRARSVRAQFRVGQPTATADLDSDRVLVRESQTLATLAGARWSEPLPALFRARLAQSFQNAGLARSIDGPSSTADYEVDVDMRSFGFDSETKQVNLDIAVWVVSLGTGRIVSDQIFTLSEPVASTGTADVMGALDLAASTVMTRIVQFVAKTL
jgi:cholesterol transport system auxiliary component